MNVGIIENLDGSIKVVEPISPFTVQDNFDKMGETGFEIDSFALPDNRTFRNAWVVGGGGTLVTVNLTKAKQNAMEVLAKPFEELIAAIAIPLAEAQDNNDHPMENALIDDRKAARVSKELKMQEILACTTVTQLEALMP